MRGVSIEPEVGKILRKMTTKNQIRPNFRKYDLNLIRFNLKLDKSGSPRAGSVPFLTGGGLHFT